MGHEVDEATRIERLLTGLAKNPEFKQDTRKFETMANLKWDFIVGKLRAWDKFDNLNPKENPGESANIAEGDQSMSGIVCHNYGTASLQHYRLLAIAAISLQ